MGKTRTAVPPFGWKVEWQHLQLYLGQKAESFPRFNPTQKRLKMIFLASRATVLWISCWSSGAGSTSSTGPSSTTGPGTSSLPGDIPRATVTRTANRNDPMRCLHIMHFNSNIFFFQKQFFRAIKHIWTKTVLLKSTCKTDSKQCQELHLGEFVPD